MTRYDESREKSAEVLRLVLAQMGRHQAALNPITFTVWYEHLLGNNPRLSADLEHSRQTDPGIGDGTVQRLYHQHVASIDAVTAERVSQQFRDVMQNLSESAARTGHTARDFGTQLHGLDQSLTAAATPQLALQVGEALAGGVLMRAAVDALQQQVATSRAEIEVLREDLQRTREEALRCPLTRLLNRKGFDQKLQALLDTANAGGQPGCLVLIDIDHFKRVNDQHGHLTGDRVLAALGEILRSMTSTRGASAARYGGEEFAILLPGSLLDGAVALAEQVREGLKRMRLRQRNTDKVVLSITASAGVAAVHRGDDAAAVVSRADAALYRAKQAGRDRVMAG